MGRSSQRLDGWLAVFVVRLDLTLEQQDEPGGQIHSRSWRELPG